MIYYEVYWCRSYDEENLIYSPDSANEDRVISQATLTQEVNEGSQFTFYVFPTNPEYDNLTPFNGIVKIYETVNGGERITKFQGKITDISFDNQRKKHVTCQGGLYWFKWSYYAKWLNKYPKYEATSEEDTTYYLLNQRARVFANSNFKKTDGPGEITRRIIDLHNWQMRENTATNDGSYDTPDDMTDTIYPGVFKIAVDSVGDDIFYARENPYGIDVKNNNDSQNTGVYLTRKITSITSTYDWFKNELIEKCDANIVVDEGTGELYVYGPLVPADTSQTIDVEENLVELTKDINFSDVCTCFLPLGKSSDSSTTTTSKTDTEEDYSINASKEVYIMTTIMDSGELEEGVPAVDPDPPIYVTTYDTDLEYAESNNNEAVSIDPDNPPEESTDTIKVITSKDTNGVLVVSDEEYPGGITFLVEPPFIVWKEGVEKYGRIIGQKQWSSATRSQLRAYGPAYFKKIIMNADSIEVKALDMGLYDASITTSLKLGRRYHVTSAFHDVDEWLPCNKWEIDLLNPANTKYTFKKSYKPFTRLIKSIEKKANSLFEIIETQKDIGYRNAGGKVIVESKVNQIQ